MRFSKALGILIIILGMVNAGLNPSEDSQGLAVLGWIVGTMLIIYSLQPSSESHGRIYVKDLPANAKRKFPPPPAARPKK